MKVYYVKTFPKVGRCSDRSGPFVSRFAAEQMAVAFAARDDVLPPVEIHAEDAPDDEEDADGVQPSE